MPHIYVEIKKVAPFQTTQIMFGNKNQHRLSAKIWQCSVCHINHELRLMPTVKMKLILRKASGKQNF